MNALAALHAWRFTHFDEQISERTKNPAELTYAQKADALLFGIRNPRPRNTQLPSTAFETIRISSHREIEAWKIDVSDSKGTVVLFHGYIGDKSKMLDKASVFLQLGYNTLLVDFMGSGGSAGNQTTIGYFEAEQVKSCFDYLEKTGEKNIFLFGTSMGAVAVMKAISDHDLRPKGIIIECPFGSMYETVCARFRSMDVPAFPMAALLVFWGGVENGFWAFDHNPTSYAKAIRCPTLLMYGARDERVSRAEIDEIFANVDGAKELIVFEDAGHENYLTKYREKWSVDIQVFLEGLK